MPQASQSPTSPRPDERRGPSPRPASRPVSLATHFVPPWADTKGPGWPRSAWRRAHRPTISGFVPAAMPTRSPSTSTNPAAVQALFARLSPGSRLALEPLRPHRIDVDLGGRAFARAANPGNRACAGHPEAARAGVAGSRSGRDFRAGRRIRRSPRVERPIAGVPPRSPGGAQDHSHDTAGRPVACLRRSDRSGPRVGRPRADHPPGGPLAAGRGRAAPPDPARSPLQARPRSDRPGPGPCRPDRRLVRPVARLTLRCGWRWPAESG